jgi:hypothetical protein
MVLQTVRVMTLFAFSRAVHANATACAPPSHGPRTIGTTGSRRASSSASAAEAAAAQQHVSSRGRTYKARRTVEDDEVYPGEDGNSEDVPLKGAPSSSLFFES